MHQHEPENDRTAEQRSAVHQVLRADGRPLDEATRTDMEARLGSDFSDVRIHDDGAARRSAAAIQARAYTSGHHVVLGTDGNDRHTLAHELTHVIQQRQGPVAGTDGGDGLRMSDPSDRFERAAEANARRALTGGPHPGPVTASDPVLTDSSMKSVQRAVQAPEDIQDLWTDNFWRDQADEASGPSARSKKTTKGRKIEEILRTGKKILNDLARAGEKPGAQSLSIYRTMKASKAEVIMDWVAAGKLAKTENWIRELDPVHGGGLATAWHAASARDIGAIPIDGHFGDREQAFDYYRRSQASGGEPRMLRFSLKPGAWNQMFSADHMALPEGDLTADGITKKRIGWALRKLHPTREFETSSGAEGNAPGYFGIKYESIGDFSLSVSKESDVTRLLFQLFLTGVEDVTWMAENMRGRRPGA